MAQDSDHKEKEVPTTPHFGAFEESKAQETDNSDNGEEILLFDSKWISRRSMRQMYQEHKNKYVIQTQEYE